MSRRADAKPVVRARDRNLDGRPGCDNTSVGALITRDDGRYLMPVRGARPAGIAPPAGHVFDWDRHGSYPDAARALITAGLRLPVKALELTAEHWRADRCGRPPGPRGTGHQWQVYTALAYRAPDPPRRRARWLDPGSPRPGSPSWRAWTSSPWPGTTWPPSTASLRPEARSDRPAGSWS